ncbi:MAG: hypothetical protein JRM77_07010 [Nitrososphaerota archaeon]|nr:hypothetical protein [Nitrososphaerota archaeon]
MFDLKKALLISAIVGVLGAVLIFGLPIMLGFAGCSLLAFVGLCSTSAFLTDALIAMLVFIAVVMLAGAAMFYLWSLLPLSAQILISVGVLLAGILLLQPELDAIGGLGLIFAMMGAGQELKKLK